ncbi:MAG: S46 family peptidase [Bacteroidales bacterium]
MRKYISIALLVLLALPGKVRADEGMWLLSLVQKINMDEMHDMGLELTAEDIYSVNHASLKDAVGALDYGSCTSELVSSEGLLLTNHHCGYGEIQAHSSVEHDYLKNGFWAMSRDEELPNEGKTVTFLVRMEEVTDQVLAGLTDGMTEEERAAKIEALSGEISAKATEGTHYEARVRSLFEGNRFFLFVLETFLDVRLVGAPPESIGKFGHDTDNWMWPRHTGDFSMFRVYTGPDGLPAEYSPDNIPLQSKYYLPVSLKGYEEGDFAMVMGFPGNTDRYITSWEVKELLEVDHPNRIKIRGTKQDIQMEDMQASDKVRIQYASKYSRSSNYWKYSIGQSKGLKNLKVVAKKEAEEEAFRSWVAADATRQAKYGTALQDIQSAIEGRRELQNASQYLYECVYMGMETVLFGRALTQLDRMLVDESTEAAKLEEMVEALKVYAADFYKDYNAPTDKKVMKAMIALLIQDLKKDYLPVNILEVGTKYKGDIDKYVDAYFKKSILVDEAKFMAFLDAPDLKVLQKDPGYQAVIHAQKYFEIRGQMAAYADAYDRGSRLYLQGRIEMNSGREYYSDANSTIRLTYGTVGDYMAADAVHYTHFTTLKGVMEKEIPNDFEFDVSPRLKELYEAKDYGPYGKDGVMNVCFTTNNDITGGNSGSPVMNSRGELIGIAFDGNWEAMSGDVAFETELQKCINVDIRYVLFVIDKYAGAGHLVEEMTLVR